MPDGTEIPCVCVLRVFPILHSTGGAMVNFCASFHLLHMFPSGMPVAGMERLSVYNHIVLVVLTGY
jgi:hypothetical protein